MVNPDSDYLETVNLFPDETKGRFVQRNERITVQVGHPPAERANDTKSSRFGTENLFSNQSTEKVTFVTDKLYFAS